MGYNTPDWQQPATIASGIVQNVGGTQREPFSGNTNADGVTWTALAIAAGRTVLMWLITNRGGADIDLGLGSAATVHTLKPSESVMLPFNGNAYVKSSAAGAAVEYEALAVEA